MRFLELLAPARNLQCGIAAIDHGADAVYIGADRFGARAAAGNSLDDISALCAYAHKFGAKVYVTVNTIIYEDELGETQSLISGLSRIGVDALLVQDMATLGMRAEALKKTGYAPLLHASTQTDNRTVEKVRWLRSLGFKRVVLARELSLEEIRDIHKSVPDVELEVFVHGALCVSFSGQCYASQCLLGRSANRGECAQVCRMKFDLIDADGKTIVHDKYLLSMKDLCQINHLEELADAGATSFKIEGRLKDVNYVKNVVSAYSQRLDEIISHRPDDYCRSSWGRVSYSFKPSLSKTFNRGYTDYFFHRQAGSLCTMTSPKALGEPVGVIRSFHYGKNGSITVVPQHHSLNGNNHSGERQSAVFANGDGLCFLNDKGELVGFRVNRAEESVLFPYRMPQGLQTGRTLYRNNDVQFEKTLQGDTAKRTIDIDIKYEAVAQGFSLTISFDANGQHIEGKADVTFEHQEAKTRQEENIRKQLSRLGNTIYTARDTIITGDSARWFVPSSLLADLRRKAVSNLEENIRKMFRHLQKDSMETTEQHNNHSLTPADSDKAQYWLPEYKKYPYLFNAANSKAQQFYQQHGIDISEPAFEVRRPRTGLAMQCRYCLRYELGYCVRRGGRRPSWKEPLTLRLGDGHEFRLDFRCDECQMNVIFK